MIGYTTITFPVQKINATDEIQLFFKFTHTGDALPPDSNINANDIGLTVLSWGEIEFSYHFEEAFLVLGELSLTIGDINNYLDNLLFGQSEFSLNTDKQFEITIQINSTEMFYGIVMEDGISYVAGDRTCTLNVSPPTNLIKEKMLFDEDGTPL